MTVFLPRTPNAKRFKRDQHSAEHRERIAEANSARARIGHMVASSEALRPRPAVSLPRISIQQDAE